MPPVHPLWRPFDQPTPEEVSSAHVGDAPSWSKTIEVVAPDPSWPQSFTDLAAIVRTSLGDRARVVEHVGSTAVPGLYAKPVIDIDLTVAGSSDESAYIPDLVATGFVFVIREPDWEEHRCLARQEPHCNLHVFSVGAMEPQRHRVFRDWLATHADDRDAYATLKRQLATRQWDSTMEYNNEKGALIYAIYEVLLGFVWVS